MKMPLKVLVHLLLQRLLSPLLIHARQSVVVFCSNGLMALIGGSTFLTTAHPQHQLVATHFLVMVHLQHQLVAARFAVTDVLNNHRRYSILWRGTSATTIGGTTFFNN